MTTPTNLLVELCNTGSNPLPGVIDVGVPNKLIAPDQQVYVGTVTEGVGPRAVVGIVGKRHGSPERGVTRLHCVPTEGFWPSGSGWFDLSPQPQPAPPSLFRVHPAVQDVHSYQVRAFYKGKQIALKPIAYHENAARRIVDLAGTLAEGPPIHFRCRVTLGFDTPYVDVQGAWTLSGFGSDAMPKLDVIPGDLQITYGESGSAEWITLLDQFMVFDGRIFAAENALQFYHRVVPETVSSIRPEDCSPGSGGVDYEPETEGHIHRFHAHLVGRLDFSQWFGHVLAQGRILDSDRIESDIPGNWNFGPSNLRAPTNTGDRGVFGSLAGQEMFTCLIEKLPQVLGGITQDSSRQVHHLKPGGVQIPLFEIDKCVVYDGVPDARAFQWDPNIKRDEVNLLSFQNGFEPAPWRPQDDAHLSLDYPILSFMLLGDWFSETYISAECDMRLKSLRRYVNIPRGTGRVISALAKLHCVIDTPGDGFRRHAIESYIADKVKAASETIQRQMASVPADAPVYPGYTAPASLFGYESWTPYQCALLVAGIYDAAKLLDVIDGTDWDVMLRVCHTIVDHGFFELDIAGQKTLRPYYTAFWTGDGSVPTAEQAALSTPASSTRLFKLQMGMAAAILLGEGQASPRAHKILDEATEVIDWDTIRYLGALPWGS